MLSWYLQLVGIFRWDIELGSIDIFHENSLMLQYQAYPRIGHLEVIYHIFAYLKSHSNMGRIGYYLMVPNVYLSVFNNNTDWARFYVVIEEELLPKMPESCVRDVSIYSFVGANNAGSFVTRRSHTGIIVFIQNAPMIWFSNKQNTFKAATFGI